MVKIYLMAAALLAATAVASFPEEDPSKPRRHFPNEIVRMPGHLHTEKASTTSHKLH